MYKMQCAIKINNYLLPCRIKINKLSLLILIEIRIKLESN